MANLSETPWVSQFTYLYKVSLNIDQNKRRENQLFEQKRRRENVLDNARGLYEMELSDANRRNRQRKTEEDYRNIIMFSEWLIEVPDDFDISWLMKVCPMGRRTIIVAEKRTTKCYSKKGKFEFKFKSILPGGFYNQEKSKQTILDCIWNPTTKTFYVLDVLVWAGRDFTSCETEFRFFWLQSKLSEMPELGIRNSHNTYTFKYTPHITCDYMAIKDEMDKYPYYENDSPGVDGILFYHKEAIYTSGRTPLFGWLKPYMIPEVVNVPVPIQYAKPENYLNILDHIRQLKIKKYRQKLERRCKKKADEDHMEM